MQPLKPTFTFGLIIGLGMSFLTSFITDLIIYLIYLQNNRRTLDADAVFLIGVAAPLLLARIWSRKDGKHEFNKGLLIAAVIWGAAFVYLFQISTVKSIFFRF